MRLPAFIEPLESRIAPAIILNVVTGPKGITVTEDSANAGASAVSFTVLANGDLVIDPTDMVTQLKINGAAPLAAGDATTLVGFTGGITAKLGAGADQATFTGRLPGAVSLDLGLGTNAVTLTDAFIGGAFTVKGGAENDSVTFAGTAVELFGPVKLTLGEGANTLANTTTTLSTGGDFVASSGKGVDDLLLGGGSVVINGKLELNSGAGGDQVGFAVTGLLQIGKTATLKSGGDINATTDQTLSGANAVGVGKLTMSVGTGAAEQRVVSTGGPVVINGAAIFTSGGGGSFGEVQISASTYLTVSESFTATTKGLDADLDVRANSVNGRIGGGFTSTGFADVIAEFSGAIVGPVKITLPTLIDGYVFLGTKVSQTAPLWLGAVTVAGKGYDHSIGLSNTIVQGALKVTTVAGNDSFSLEDTVLLAAASVDLGDDDDDFYIESGATPPGTSQIFARLLLKGGGGDDTFTFGGNVANTTLRAVAQITADGGAGQDTLITGNNATFLVPLKQIGF